MNNPPTHSGSFTVHAQTLDDALDEAKVKLALFLGDGADVRLWTRSWPGQMAQNGAVLLWSVDVEWQMVMK